MNITGSSKDECLNNPYLLFAVFTVWADTGSMLKLIQTVHSYCQLSKVSIITSSVCVPIKENKSFSILCNTTKMYNSLYWKGKLHLIVCICLVDSN